MKIVVLDGYGLNPGDLSWEEMRALGELTVYDRTAPAELLERSAGAEVLITNKTVITAEDMAALPALKYIGVLATGYNIVDIQAAKARGIIVTNIPAYSTASVAQMVFSAYTEHHPACRPLCLCQPSRALGEQSRLLLLGYRPGGTGREETGNHRLGKHRTGDGAHRCRFRNAGMRLYFQAAVTTSRRNPENGAG